MADNYKRSFLVDLEILQYLSVVLTEKTDNLKRDYKNKYVIKS